MAGNRLSAATLRSLLCTRTPTRRFSSAAALQLHCDSESEDERVHNSIPDACGDAEDRGVQWVFMGAQKHVYASKISRLLDVPYISMGSLVRQELHPGSSLYKQIANAVTDRKVVPEEIIFSLLSRRLEERRYRGETGFILDGIPRTLAQAEILDQIVDIDLVVNFKCKGCLLKDKFGSGICSYCGKSARFGISDSTNISPSSTLKACFNQLNSAANDIQGTSDEETQPLENYYRKQRKLLNFQVTSGPGETWKGLLAALHLQQVDAVSSSQKLTT